MDLHEDRSSRNRHLRRTDRHRGDLAWTRSPDATGYYIHVRNVSAGETAFTRLPWPVGGPTWISAGLVPGAHYQYRVQPINGYLTGSLSNTADVTVTRQR